MYLQFRLGYLLFYIWIAREVLLGVKIRTLRYKNKLCKIDGFRSIVKCISSERANFGVIGEENCSGWHRDYAKNGSCMRLCMPKMEPDLAATKTGSCSSGLPTHLAMYK